MYTVYCATVSWTVPLRTKPTHPVYKGNKERIMPVPHEATRTPRSRIPAVWVRVHAQAVIAPRVHTWPPYLTPIGFSRWWASDGLLTIATHRDWLIPSGD